LETKCDLRRGTGKKKHLPRIQSLPYKAVEPEVEHQQEFLPQSNRNSAEDPDHQATETLALKAASGLFSYPTQQRPDDCATAPKVITRE